MAFPTCQAHETLDFSFGLSDKIRFSVVFESSGLTVVRVDGNECALILDKAGILYTSDQVREPLDSR